jgi:hypothetical protein
MVKLKAWQYRREIYKWDVAPEGKFFMLFLLDHFDWNTGERYFKSWESLDKWLTGLAEKCGAQNQLSLHRAMFYMEMAGMLVKTDVGAEGLHLALQQPTAVEELEQYLQAARAAKAERAGIK